MWLTLFQNRPRASSTLHCIALHCIALHCIALHCIALHCIALHCIALHIALHCIAYCTALHCTALHCTALHCTALHCTALHCTALHCTAPCTCIARARARACRAVPRLAICKKDCMAIDCGVYVYEQPSALTAAWLNVL